MTPSGIFIFGYMHCGTTLLQQILSKHPSIYCERKELKFIQSLARIKQLYPDLNVPSKRQEYIAFCVFAIKNALKASSDFKTLPINSYREEGTDIQSPSSSHLGIYFDVYEHLAGDHRYWMDGSPNNVFYHKEIRQLLPDARFIAIVRDVRDVLASKKRRRDTTTAQRYRQEQILEQKKLEKNYSCVTDSLSWKSTYSLCHNLTLKDPNTMLIRYEDLTRDPESVVRRLCEFLNVEYADSLVDIRFSNSEDISKRSKGIFANSGNYSRHLTESEIHVAQSVTRKLLYAFDYALEPVSMLGRLKSIVAWLEFLPHLLRRIWNRYRLLGFWNFVAFMKLSSRKFFRGILGRAEVGGG